MKIDSVQNNCDVKVNKILEKITLIILKNALMRARRKENIFKI